MLCEKQVECAMQGVWYVEYHEDGFSQALRLDNMCKV